MHCVQEMHKTIVCIIILNWPSFNTSIDATFSQCRHWHERRKTMNLTERLRSNSFLRITSTSREAKFLSRTRHRYNIVKTRTVLGRRANDIEMSPSASINTSSDAWNTVSKPPESFHKNCNEPDKSDWLESTESKGYLEALERRFWSSRIRVQTVVDEKTNASLNTFFKKRFAS